MARHLTMFLTALLVTIQGMVPVFADEVAQGRTARSADYSASAKTVPNIFDVKPEDLSQLRVEGFRERPGVTTLGKTRHLCDCELPELSVHSAQVDLVWDQDYDGYYQQFVLTFDADLATGRHKVFAKLYLSFEGGPWNYLHTTRSFQLERATSSDEYSIETILDAGYPTGYYDILLEFYDADSGEYLMSFGPNEDLGLYAVPLEDQTRDRHSGSDSSYEVNTYLYGSGSLDWLTLGMAGLGFGVFRQQLRAT
ncbi:MAG: choice-of-anchor H family protein [Thiotrichales bacterium]